MKFTFILKVVLILCSVPSYAATICDPANLRRLQQRQGTFSSSLDLFGLTATQSHLHIFGDTHYYTDTKMIGRLLAELRAQFKGSKNCTFLELPKGGLEMFSRLYKVNRQRPNLTAEEIVKMDAWGTYFPSIVQAAESLGMAYFEVDHPDHLRRGRSEAERNEAMARNISDLMTNGECNNAILIVGKEHVSPSKNQPSLVQLLKSAGIKPVTYNLADFDQELGVWIRPECSPKERFPSAFSNSILKNGTKLMPDFKDERSPLWNDFDYSISR
jgi:hypothetical protein